MVPTMNCERYESSEVPPIDAIMFVSWTLRKSLLDVGDPYPTQIKGYSGVLILCLCPSVSQSRSLVASTHSLSS
jgi:hypothetical protein